MSKARFEIGESEKHIISVNANPFLKFIRIEIDGERVVNVANFTPSREFKLDVGNLEKHQVQINIRALSPIKLFVDGNDTQQM